VTLSGTNTYGSLSGASGAAINGGTVIRNGTLVITSSAALVAGGTIELGDATFVLATAADFATSGSSLLGVERNFSFIADNRSSLGGVFLANGGGLFNGDGSATDGAGAFYNVSNIIDGQTFGAGDVGKRILVKDELDSPERNGIYSIVQINADGTLNLLRVTDFSTAANMRYGTSISVSGGSSAGQTFFMASPTVTLVNGTVRVSSTTPSGSQTATVASTVGLSVGARVSGSGIEDGTFIVSIDDATHFTLSQPAASAITNGTLLTFEGTDPVHWLADASNPNVTLKIDNASVTTVSQSIDINANGTGNTIISATNPVNFTGNVRLQNLTAGARDSKVLYIQSTTSSGGGVTFSGVISETAGGTAGTDDILELFTYGSGSVTLTGNNTYHGGTTVSEGTLYVNNTAGSGTGSGNVSVGSSLYTPPNTTLAGDGTIAPAAGKNITVYTGASLSVGTEVVNPLTAVGQDLTINLLTGSTLTLAGTLRLDLFSNNHSQVTLDEADRLVFSGTGSVDLTGSTLIVNNINNLAASSFIVGDTWKLIDWSTVTRVGNSTFSNLTGNYLSYADLPDLDGINSGKFWDISNLYTQGTITVAVPEPGRLLLLILGILALGSRRRRRW
jgi:autotransporter-associated beta strand protein